MVLEKDGRRGKSPELVPEHVYFFSSSTFPFFLFQLWNAIFVKSKWFWKKMEDEGKALNLFQNMFTFFLHQLFPSSFFNFEMLFS
jgi:hypothetical protein